MLSNNYNPLPGSGISRAVNRDCNDWAIDSLAGVILSFRPNRPELKNRVSSQLQCVELYVTDVYPVVGRHGGPLNLYLNWWVED